MKCLDHALHLRANRDHQLECPSCQSIWASLQDLDLISPSHRGLLALETRLDSMAFKKQRLCIECSSVMKPLRVAMSENWIWKCSDCERFWLDKIAQRQLRNFAQQKAREEKFNKLSAAEKQEFKEHLSAAAKETAPESPLTGPQMFLSSIGIPVLTDLNSQRVPWMTLCLLVLMFLLRFLGGTPGALLLSYHPAKSPLTLITANFVHLQWLHLLGNALFLIAFGNALEQILKRRFVLLSFLLLGPLTVLGQSLFSSENAVILGASGSVSVLVAAAAMLQPQSRFLYNPFAVGTFLWGKVEPFRVPIRIFVAFYVVYTLVMAASGARGVAWYGHLTGLCLGLLLGHLAKMPQTAAMFQLADKNNA